MTVSLFVRVRESREARMHAYALLAPRNHPGHPDQKSHGRKKRLPDLVPDPPVEEGDSGEKSAADRINELTRLIREAKTPAERKRLKEQRSKLAEEAMGTKRRSKVASLPRTKGRAETPSAAAKAANPSFGSTNDGAKYYEQGKAGQRWTPSMGPLPAGAYEENCTNAVNAFEMRMRGFDVTAAPLDVLDKHGYAAGRTYAETDQLLADAWTLPGGEPHGRSFAGQKWRSFKEINGEIERDWPEGGRGVITVGKHIFNATKVNGKARYVEAQYDATPTRNVTRLYQSRFKGYAGWSDGGVQEGKLIRLDDLVPTDGILAAVEVPR